MYLIQTGLLLMIIFHTVQCEKYLEQDKRSVFDIIRDTDEESIKNQNSNINKQASVLSKVLEDEKSVKYQYLRNIFAAHKQRHGESVIFQAKRHEMKRQFLKAMNWRNETKFKERRQSNILMNFCFLTKLS